LIALVLPYDTCVQRTPQPTPPPGDENVGDRSRAPWDTLAEFPRKYDLSLQLGESDR
jgi:hypothetical protein